MVTNLLNQVDVVLDPVDMPEVAPALGGGALPPFGDKLGAAVDVRRERVLVVWVADVAETFLAGVCLRGCGEPEAACRGLFKITRGPGLRGWVLGGGDVGHSGRRRGVSYRRLQKHGRDGKC